MIGEQDREHLDDILRHADEALHFLGELDAAAVARDRKTFVAVSYDLLVIGEAARRVSVELRGRLTAVPWKQVIAMRNHLAHGYDDIELEVVVDTIRNHLPSLMRELRAALRDDE